MPLSRAAERTLGSVGSAEPPAVKGGRTPLCVALCCCNCCRWSAAAKGFSTRWESAADGAVLAEGIARTLRRPDPAVRAGPPGFGALPLGDPASLPPAARTRGFISVTGRPPLATTRFRCAGRLRLRHQHTSKIRATTSAAKTSAHTTIAAITGPLSVGSLPGDADTGEAVGAATTGPHAVDIELADTGTPLTFETASERAARNATGDGTPPPPPMREASLAVEATPGAEAAQKLQRRVSWYATEPCDSKRSLPADRSCDVGSTTTRPSLSDREDGAGPWLGERGTRAQGDGEADVAVFESPVGGITASSEESAMEPPLLGSAPTVTPRSETEASGRPREQARDARSGKPTAAPDRMLANAADASKGRPETTRAMC